MDLDISEKDKLTILGIIKNSLSLSKDDLNYCDSEGLNKEEEEYRVNMYEGILRVMDAGSELTSEQYQHLDYAVQETLTQYPSFTETHFGCDCGCGGDAYSAEQWDDAHEGYDEAYSLLMRVRKNKENNELKVILKEMKSLEERVSADGQSSLLDGKINKLRSRINSIVG